jgi:hypothetical protein
MTVAVGPIDFLKHHLDPLSGTIDSFGGAHVVMGLIAAGGQPHVYIMGNLNNRPVLRKEIYTELANKLLEMASSGPSPNGVILPGPGSVM